MTTITSIAELEAIYGECVRSFDGQGQPIGLTEGYRRLIEASPIGRAWPLPARKALIARRAATLDR
jgi:hypothetical protein